jgi:hypothetical protein
MLQAKLASILWAHRFILRELIDDVKNLSQKPNDVRELKGGILCSK